MLSQNPRQLSPDQRVEFAHRARELLADVEWTASEHPIVQEILSVLAGDVEQRVRKALAESLADAANVPAALVKKLAADDALVAMPMLQSSLVLTTDDLLELVATFTSQEKLGAIAERRSVPVPVADALIEKGSEAVVLKLLHNDGAQLSEKGLHRIVDRYGERQPIQEGLIDRSKLPPSLIERMVGLVSRALIERLVKNHAVPPRVAVALASDTQDRAFIGLASGLSEDSVQKLIEGLDLHSRISSNLIMRCLCSGNVDLIAQIVAARSMTPPELVKHRILTNSESDLPALWTRARMPAEMLTPAIIAIQTLRDSRHESDKWDLDYFRRRITERLITALDAYTIDFEDDLTAQILALPDAVNGQPALKH